MKTSEEIVRSITTTIGYIYCRRPLMYGGTAAGVDVLLDAYHQLWAEIVERSEEYRAAYWQVLKDEECGSASFSGRYQTNHPDADEAEVAEYAVRQWRKVSDQLGVPIDHAALHQEFAGFASVDWTQREREMSWSITRRHLAEARQLLPEQACLGELTKLLNAYDEYLSQNELELALDSLEGIGDQADCPHAFWSALHRAAANMELPAHIARFQQRLAALDDS